MDVEEEDRVEPDYIHIRQNEFWHRKHKKQKEEDLAICECDGEGECCGESCLNVLTSTECTPQSCPSGLRCNNQRFQKWQYALTQLFHTRDRGWGLIADQHIQAGQFIIEYCGEVISWKEAKRRSHAYHLQGITDAYIISLNASESIDATKKGSLARFINHSCQPNCETRKWNVLGEIRVGIFAKQDIAAGTELSYNYNFEWYGGAKVRCLCGAPACSGFLGAKSRGFQEDTYLWEDDDERYSVEKIPLYDSAEDDPSAKLFTRIAGNLLVSECTTLVIQSLETKAEVNEKSSLASRKYQSGPKPKPKKRSKRHLKILGNQVDAKAAAILLQSKEAQEEVLKFEEIKNEASSHLECLYDEIRPAIEEHERDNQDSVATSVAEKWIEASCLKLKTEFDVYFSIVKNIAVPKPLEEAS